MARASKETVASPQHARLNDSRLSALPLTLALWQLRQTWRLLLVVGAGVIASVVLVCAVPLYSQISMTAEVRNLLITDPKNTEIKIYSIAPEIDLRSFQFMQLRIDKEMQRNLGPFLIGPAQFSFQMGGVDILVPQTGPNGQTVLRKSGNQMNIIGSSPLQSASHIDLLAGRFPQNNDNAIEVAITPSTSRNLSVGPGAVIPIRISFLSSIGEILKTINQKLLVVGIFKPKPNDTFWHGESFECDPLGGGNATCKALVSNDAVLTSLNYFTLDPKLAGSHIETKPYLSWYYHLDTTKVDVNNLGAVQTGLSNMNGDITGPSFTPRYIEQTTVIDPISDVLGQYNTRSTVVQIPITSLFLLVVGLTLFFVVMMTSILVERQAEVIAVLRSRGASRLQIFSSFLTQSVGISLIALIVAPLIAILVVPLISLSTLTHSDAGAVNVITSEPQAVLQEILVPALVTVGVAILAMTLSIGGAVQRGILSLRREYARSTHRPLWQRLNVDMIAAIIALAVFSYSVYENSPGVLDERVRVLILPPLTVLGVFSLLLGLSLLLLRTFPLLLRWAARLSIRNHGAAPMLAIAQMARSPRQSLRMTILLAFSIAFVIFTLIFNASQSQRKLDVANHEVGADFNGKLSNTGSQGQPSAYSHIPGVLSATIGYTSFPRASENSLNYSFQLLAADADTFAHTFIWTSQNSTQPIALLMQQLVAQRSEAIASSTVPAIVDSAAWNTLHLSPGVTFHFFDNKVAVDCIPIAEVQSIPTMNDSAFATGTNDFAAAGGILVDWQTLMAVSQKVNGIAPTSTDIWLNTRSDAPSLASVRAALSKGKLQLGNLNDRRAIIDSLSNDPLYLDLTGLLFMGAIIAILLAFVGNLIASWVSVRNRLTNFAVLRALGTVPRQLATILIWEQSIVYATALLLGVSLGIVLSELALPSLIFTNLSIIGLNGSFSSEAYYILQTVPRVQIVIPPSLGIVFVVIVLMYMIALGTMVRVVARSSISQTLRLNED
jgi:ABC-type antimicrobial peptide transport system permease subunit